MTTSSAHRAPPPDICAISRAGSASTLRRSPSPSRRKPLCQPRLQCRPQRRLRSQLSHLRHPQKPGARRRCRFPRRRQVRQPACRRRFPRCTANAVGSSITATIARSATQESGRTSPSRRGRASVLCASLGRLHPSWREKCPARSALPLSTRTSFATSAVRATRENTSSTRRRAWRVPPGAMRESRSRLSCCLSLA